MNAYIWKTQNAGYKYVCGYTGSDYYGDGTMANPFKTLTKAYFYGTVGGTINCRGLFSDSPLGSSLGRGMIQGDYYGAAIWDGQGLTTLSGFLHSNILILNTNTYTGMVGIGEMQYPGNTSWFSGVGGSNVLVYNCQLLNGIIGGLSSISHVIYSTLNIADILLSFGGEGQGGGDYQNITVHNVTKNSVNKCFNNNLFQFKYSLFTDFPIYLDQNGIFDTCLFNSECTFWVSNTQFIPTGLTDADKLASVAAKVATVVGTKITLSNCKYTSQTSDQIYTNVDKLDYTLKPNSDAVIPNNLNSDFYYYGALKPALNVPILADSHGITGTWDEHTASGAIAIPSDSIIYLDETNTSAVSQISSKIVAINNQMILLDGFKSMFIPRFGYKYYLGNKQMISSTKIYAGTNLNVGRYIVTGFPILYNTQNFEVGDILVVTATGTSFTNYNTNTSYLYEILDPNIFNPVYVRQTNAIYASVAVGDLLQSGGVYLNYSNQNITYAGRTIVPGESFTCDGINMTYSGTAGYVIGIVFDDTRVPVTEWISALSFDDYFNGKTGAVQMYDNEGIPISCGNPKAYVAPYLGTYGMQYLNKTYIQFKIILRKYDTV